MKATKEQIIAEANRRRAEHGEGAPPVEHYIVDVVCENWTPPEPVDPDLMAFREWSDGHFRLGDFDRSLMTRAFLAGARMAREQERERARPLVEYVEIDAVRLDGVGGRALAVLAKYEDGGR